MTWGQGAVVAIAVLGVLYWALSLAGSLHTASKVAWLKQLDPPQPAKWPKLTVVVPACDEVRTLEQSVRSLLAAEYPDLEVVLVDDRSKDGTGALVDRLASDDRRIRPVHVTELPAGWLGKVHAMHVGAQTATGDWLLFCDADVHLSAQALPKAIAWCESRGLDFVSAIPTVEPARTAVDAAVQLFMRLLVGTSRLWAVEDPASSAVFGVGVFLLVRRSAFARTEGFSWLKLEVADDVALALMMKRSGARCAPLRAVGDIGIRVYDGVGQMIRALEKNGFAILGRCSAARTLVFAALLPLFELAFLWAFAPVGPWWLPWLGAAGAFLSLASTAHTAHFTGAKLWLALLYPLGVAIWTAAMVRAGIKGARQGGVVWRGTLYKSEELRAGIRVRFPE